jgi:hypothetical protein
MEIERHLGTARRLGREPAGGVDGEGLEPAMQGYVAHAEPFLRR